MYKRPDTGEHGEPTKDYPVVIVIWEDSWGDSGLRMVRYVEPEPWLIKQVGFLIKETASHIIIAWELHYEGKVKVTSIIPKRDVKYMRKVRIRK